MVEVRRGNFQIDGLPRVMSVAEWQAVLAKASPSEAAMILEATLQCLGDVKIEVLRKGGAHIEVVAVNGLRHTARADSLSEALGAVFVRVRDGR